MYQVLIVDDESLMREALRAMVSKVDGFHVADCVSSGNEAVEICRHRKIDIVFMDIMMPGISGIEASKIIYSMNPSVTIYIISAYRNFEFAREALSIKVSEYVSKPVSFSTIARLLTNYRQGQIVEDTRMDILTAILEQCRYDQIHVMVPEIVQNVFQQNANDLSNIKNYFIKMGESLFAAVDLFGKQAIDIGKRFPINIEFGHESVFWTFWLSDIMDYAFRQVATLKCEHLQRVFSYIDENIEKSISLCQVCEKCNISQGYLSKRFKQHLGISVMDYIHLRKIKCAKVYVAYTDLSMGDIAYRQGYNESSYFTKVFKKYEGMTPQQYRNKVLSI